MSRVRLQLLVALVALPGFLLGQRLRAGELAQAGALLPLLLGVVLIASLLVRERG